MKKLKILGIGLGVGYLAGKHLNRQVTPHDRLNLWKYMFSPVLLSWLDRETAEEALWQIQDYIRKSRSKYTSAYDVVKLVNPNKVFRDGTEDILKRIGWSTWHAQDPAFGHVEKSILGYRVVLPMPVGVTYLYPYSNYISYKSLYGEEHEHGSIQGETEIACDSGE